MSEESRPQFFSYSFGDQKIDIPIAYDEQGRPKVAHYIYDGKVIEVPQEYDDQGRLKTSYYICGDSIQGISLNYDDQGRPAAGHLIFDRKITELPAAYDTIGDRVALNVTPLRNTDIMVYDPGRRVTASCESKKTYLDGEKGILLYCGYPIEQIAEKGSYLETSYLLLNNELPTEEQFDEFKKDIRDLMPVHDQFNEILGRYKRDTHPMLLIHNMVAALDAFHNGVDITKPEDRYSVALNLIAKIPTIAAMAYRYTEGKPFVLPQSRLSYTENYYRMCFLYPGDTDIEKPPILMNTIDLLFILHAEHELNNSTAMVRDSGSTRVKPYAAIAAGIVSLSGPLHGGANEAVINMLEGIKSTKDIDRLIRRAQQKDFKIPGFGHPVYKTYDPRAKIIRQRCHDVLHFLNIKNDLFAFAMEMEERIEADSWCQEKNLYPNVDFYSGILMKALHFEKKMFTPNFAIPRITGWIAHWIEMVESGDMLIRPRQRYIGPEKRDWIPMELRGPIPPTPEERLRVQFATQHLG